MPRFDFRFGFGFDLMMRASANKYFSKYFAHTKRMNLSVRMIKLFVMKREVIVSVKRFKTMMIYQVKWSFFVLYESAFIPQHVEKKDAK